MMPRKRQKICLFFGLLLFQLGSCVSSTSSAEPASDDGRHFFEMGVQAYSEGRYRPAIAAFVQAYRLTKRPGLLFSLAQAYRRAYEGAANLADLRAALTHYRLYLATKPSGERKRQAEQYVRDLELQSRNNSPPSAEPIGASSTELVIAASVPEARLQLDGAVSEPLPRTADVTAGQHRVAISAPGYEPFERTVDVHEGEVITVNAQLVRASALLSVTGHRGAQVLVDGRAWGQVPTGAVPLPSGSHVVEVHEPGHYTVRRRIDLTRSSASTLELAAPPTTERRVAWALIGGGATGLVAGGVLGYVALRKDSEAQRLDRDEPNNYVAFNQTVSARNGFRLAAFLSAGLGTASGVAGAILMFSTGPAPVHEASVHRLTPSFSFDRNAMQIALRTRF